MVDRVRARPPVSRAHAEHHALQRVPASSDHSDGQACNAPTESLHRANRFLRRRRCSAEPGGGARVTDDAEAVEAALAMPETPLRRVVGTDNPFKLEPRGRARTRADRRADQGGLSFCARPRLSWRPPIQNDPPAKGRLAQALMGKPETNVGELCADLGVTRQTLYRHVIPDGRTKPDGERLLGRATQRAKAAGLRRQSTQDPALYPPA